MTAHKHAHLMLQYAQDAAETDTPWERWEYNIPEDGVVWHPFTVSHPSWMPELEYRRKHNTMTYTVTIPEPLREAPKRGESYYIPDAAMSVLYNRKEWDGCEIDKRLYRRGLCFATKEDAIAAAKAMMPVNGEE